jgi:acyl-CoA thioester hydrolase
MIYYHKHEVRWSDIDANRHLANSSYVQYCAQTRMAFMTNTKWELLNSTDGELAL